MPTRKSFVKPNKGNLLVKKGTRDIPEAPVEITAGMRGGEARSDSKHWYPKRHTPIILEPESLDADGIAQKRATISLLTKVILPNSLSSKSTDIADKRSLVNKLNRCRLEELRRLIPDRIKRMSTEKLQSILDGTEEILDEESVEIQTLYLDVSP